MDTPGIGGSGEVTQKVMGYLPSAVSFIFVINIGSAGGMQTDRVNVIIIMLSLMVLKKVHIRMLKHDQKNSFYWNFDWYGYASYWGLKPKVELKIVQKSIILLIFIKDMCWTLVNKSTKKKSKTLSIGLKDN